MLPMPLAVFRLDSSKILGSGHVQRCITLANYLREEGFNSVFLCKEYEGHFGRLITEAKFQLCFLKPHLSEEEDAEASRKILDSIGSVPLLIVDNYSLSGVYEKLMRKVCSKIMVIDDLMNRTHDCDILLDQNYKQDYSNAYTELVPADCKKFLGPSFSLLRPQFFERKQYAKDTKTALKNIFVFFGGSDPTGETLRFLKDINQQDQLHYHVLLSRGNRTFDEIQSLKHTDKFTLHIEPDNIASIMEQCEFYVGSGGTITWERMCMKLSGLVIAVADNQIPGAQALHADGLHFYLGEAKDVDYKTIPHQILKLEKSSLSQINDQIKQYNALFSFEHLKNLFAEIKGK